MAIVGLAGFAGVVVFGLLYIVFFFKGISLKLPVIGMVLFTLVVAVAALFTKLGFNIPFLSGSDAEPTETVWEEGPDGVESLTPGADGFPQLLLNKRGLVITATGLTEGGGEGPTLNVTIENRSETGVTVQVSDPSVNSWMMDATFSVDVAAGQKAEGSILFLSSKMERSGIETIADMEFSFHILNQDRVTFLDSDPVTVRTPAADTYQDSFDDSGEELYNENGVRIIAKGFSETESVFGPGLVLFLENTTDKAITVQAKDVSVNGSAADVIFSEDILAGKRSAAAVIVIGVPLQDIRNMKFYCRVLDRDQRTTLFDTAPFTIVV